MTDKILFWIDDGFLQFGIAKFLRELVNYDFYAIFDTNYVTKKFFANQKIVDFKKTWFFRNFLSKKGKKPDIDYLSNIEKKYEINLWQLAYSERRFYKFNKYHNFTYDEILSITEDECRIYEKILDEIKPDFVCINVTDLHRNHLFSKICYAKKIRVLMLNPVRFGNKMLISEKYDEFDDFDEAKINYSNLKKRSEEELQNFLNNSSAYNRIKTALDKKYSEEKYKLTPWDIMNRHLKFLFLICNDKYREFYENWGITRLRFLTRQNFIIPFLIKRWYRQSYLEKVSKKSIDLDIPFIYFPLQHEPERSILYGAPFWTNQVELIRHIAKSIPLGYKLYVKEHFSMKIQAWRKRSFYREITEMPNVVLLHPLVKPEKILKNCSMVASITGTTALEAGFFNKPSIVFAKLIFSYLPFVYLIKNIEELPEIIRKCLKTKHDFSTLNHFIDFLNEQSFEYDRVPLTRAVASKIHDYNGMTKEVNIPEEKMKKFLEEYSSDFKLLSSEYLKKINKIRG